MASATAAVLTSLASSFGVMLIGLYASRSGWLSEAQRKGIAALYAQLVFPMMVFKGVSAIDVTTIDAKVALVVLASKAVLATLVLLYGAVTLRPVLGPAWISHAAAFAMAASHSFDVTLGVPLAKELYPDAVAYVYLNQSLQLVVINPILLVLMDLGDAAGKGSTASTGQLLAKAMLATARNPLVVFTAAGMAASQLYPAGLPAVVGALAAQVSQAGPCLGFLCLGFALGALGGTTALEAAHAVTLCGAKLALMPLLYLNGNLLVGCDTGGDFLGFLGSLPASASVYSLSLTRNLSPRVVGPLVPLSMILSVIMSLGPLFPQTAEAQVAERVRGTMGLAAGIAAVVALSISRFSILNPSKPSAKKRK